MTKQASRAIAAATVVIGALIAVASMSVFGWGFFAQSTADFRGETAAKEKTRADGDYRIAAYDHFFDLCASVQSDENQIAALRAEMKTATPKRRDQIVQTIGAISANRFETISQYNADARKTDTAAHFRDSGLPHQLSRTAKETTCAAD